VKPDLCLMDASAIYAKYKKRPILNAGILGAKGTGLIDTAAKMSVAAHSLYRILINKRQKFEETDVYIGLADGTRSKKYVLLTEVDVHVMDRTISTTFLTMPRAENNYTLLGMNFIEKANIVINVYLVFCR